MEHPLTPAIIGISGIFKSICSTLNKKRWNTAKARGYWAETMLFHLFHLFKDIYKEGGLADN